MTAIPLPVEDTALEAARERARQVERAVFREVFRPRDRMTLLEWAESRRYLSPEANALAVDAGGPVRYSSALTPYHREPMAALSDPETQIVVCKFPSQDGKTEILNNFIGWKIDTQPGPMLILQPTLDLAKTWSKDRLAPMLRDTPALRGKVRDARSRDADNTMLHKKFPGGHLTAVGSNAPAGLAARPIRDVVVDEVDRCAVSAGTEGDPIGLAFRRATTFRKGKKALISSPTIKGQSRIHREYELGTQEEWHVPCPHCGTMQFLVWGGRDIGYGLKWEPGRPETAHYVCLEGCVIEEHHKGWMIEHGQWIAKNPDAGKRRRSFWKNILTSNLVAWRELVFQWLEAQGFANKLQEFFNTALCELWDLLDGEEVELDPLKQRRGAGYPEGERLVPDGVAVLTRSVDVQGDRLETAVWGWGEKEEAWLVEHELIAGEPSASPAVWEELTEIRGRTYTTVSGVVLRPLVTFIDSGGHSAKEVYTYTKRYNSSGVYAIKGSSLEGAALLGKPTRNNNQKAILYMVGSFTGKESLMRRLVKVKEPGPGYIHLPEWLDDEQVAQFTREQLVQRVGKGGRAVREWVQTGRNEMIDLYVYALAALHKLGHRTVANLGRIAADRVAKQQLAVAESQDSAGTQQPTARPRTPARRRWVNAWKG